MPKETAYEELKEFIGARSGVDNTQITKEALETFDNDFFARLGRERLWNMIYDIVQRVRMPSTVLDRVKNFPTEVPKDPEVEKKLSADIKSVFDDWREASLDDLGRVKQIQIREMNWQAAEAVMAYRDQVVQVNLKHKEVIRRLQERLDQNDPTVRVPDVWTDYEILRVCQDVLGVIEGSALAKGFARVRRAAGGRR